MAPGHAAFALWASLLLLPLCSPASAATTSTVYYRQRQHGPIVAWDTRDDSKRELEDSDSYARFVGMALHRASRRVFWSDSRVIRSASIDADGSASAQARVLLGGLVRVTWTGSNFGQAPSSPAYHIQAGDALQLTVKGAPCVSVLHHSPDRVQCLVAVPDRVPFASTSLAPPPSSIVTESDCTIRTARGAMTGAALNYYEMVAEGYPSPLVERIDIDARYVLPHALAVDDAGATAGGHQWLYWSNSADGCIYRSSLQSTAIEVLREQSWGVRGLAVATVALSVGDTAATTVFYSQETKGTISALVVSASSPSSVASAANRVLIRNLHGPRGLAVEAPASASALTLFFTEKTGRLYRAQLGHQAGAAPTRLSGTWASFPEDKGIRVDTGSGITVQRILTLPTTTRLDGIAVDSGFIYWCETNANVLARAPRDTFRRQVLVGGTANSRLSWPRGVALLSGDASVNSADDGLFYSEYLGRISRGASQAIVVNELRAASLVYLDHQIQEAAAVQGDASHRHVYALE